MSSTVSNQKHSTRWAETWSLIRWRHAPPSAEEEAAAKANAKSVKKINDTATAYLLPYADHNDYENRHLTVRQRDMATISKNCPSEDLEQNLKQLAKWHDGLVAELGPEVLDEKCWVDGKEYCHIFFHKDLNVNAPLRVFNRECPRRFSGYEMGFYVFKLETIEEETQGPD